MSTKEHMTPLPNGPPESNVHAEQTLLQHGVADPLSNVLPKLWHLNLTSYVKHDSGVMSANGGYGDVFIGHVEIAHLQHFRPRFPLTNVVKVAIKRIRARLGKEKNFIKRLAREIGIWARLDHKNVLPFLGYTLENDYPSLVSEWIENGTLREYMQRVPDCDIRRLALGVAKGLEYLHAQDVVHSDMKADNILISQAGEPLICDFGISRMLDSSHTLFVSTTHNGGEAKGSIRWMAIELHITADGNDPKHTKETDIWGFGMTLYEMISKEVPYSHLTRDIHVMSAVMKGELPAKPDSTSALTYLSLWPICCQCWKASPNDRITIEQIVNLLQHTNGFHCIEDSESTSVNLFRFRTFTLTPKNEGSMDGLGQLQHQPFSPPSIAVAENLIPITHIAISNFYQAIRSSDGRLLTIDELRYRHGELKTKLELDRMELSSAKPTTQDMVNALALRHREIQQRGAVITQIAEHVKDLIAQQEQQQNGMQSQQSGPSINNDSQGQGTLNPLGIPNAAQQQSGQQHLPMNQIWTQQMNNGNGNNQVGNGMLNNQQIANGGQQHNGQTQASHPQIASPFHPNLVQSQRQPPVPRSGPSPQQMHQNGHQPSPQPPPNGVQQGNLDQQVSGPDGQDSSKRPNFPPLAREKFTAMIQDWWQRQGIKFNSQILNVGNRQIDIYQLHTEVLQYGGVLNVKRYDLWNVIAVKMGWSAAVLGEAGRTQDQISEQFKVVYEQLLESFEQTYGPSQPGTMPSTQLVMLMVKMAGMTTEQMRAQGYPEKLINSVEQNRPALQDTLRRMEFQRHQQMQLQQQQLEGGFPPSQSAAPQSPSPHHMAASPHSIPRLPTSQPQPLPMLPQKNLRMPPTRTPQNTPVRPPSVTQGKQKSMAVTSLNAMDSAPSPVASAPLPAATPNNIQASPQTPKSPKPKTKTQRKAHKNGSARSAPGKLQSIKYSLKRSREEDSSASSGSTSLKRMKVECTRHIRGEIDGGESELKLDFVDPGYDPLRHLGIRGEIDGGESGYFNSSDMLKWDSVSASSGDNSWAIST